MTQWALGVIIMLLIVIACGPTTAPRDRKETSDEKYRRWLYRDYKGPFTDYKGPFALLAIALFAALATGAHAQQLEELRLPRGARMPTLLKVPPPSRRPPAFPVDEAQHLRIVNGLTHLDGMAGPPDTQRGPRGTWQGPPDMQIEWPPPPTRHDGYPWRASGD